MFAEHDAKGSANTMRGFQGERPSLYDFEAQMKKFTVPTLIVVGDEDEPCLEPSFLMKRWIPTSGLVVFPKTGHVCNQEEPATVQRGGRGFHRACGGRALAGARSAIGAGVASPLAWTSPFPPPARGRVRAIGWTHPVLAMSATC